MCKITLYNGEVYYMIGTEVTLITYLNNEFKGKWVRIDNVPII